MSQDTNNTPGPVGAGGSSSNSSDVWSDVASTYDRSEILTWLSPLEPHLRHYDVQRSRVSKVGDWLLRTEEFRSWCGGDGQCESQKAAIFCSGNLGAGKTCISSLVIDTLCNEVGEAGEDNAVACFYFDSEVQKEQSATTILGALLKQVVGFKQIPKEIMDAFRKQKGVIGGRKLGLEEIVKVLGSLSSSRRTFLCLDGLDECAAEERAKILLSLKEIIKISPTARLFMTGRSHVGGEVERHLSGGVEVISISPRKDDIIQYIHTKLVEDATSDEMDRGLKAEIVKKIPEAVSDIFRLVSLNLGAILQETSIHRRRERLRAGTDALGLEDTYGATLERIKAQGDQKSRLALAALMWICYSERSLGVVELCQALAVEIGSTDYSSENVSSIRTVLSCCQGLLVVDAERSTVRLIHHTLKDYLTSHPDLFRNPHSVIAEACLTYLNSKQVIAISASNFQGTQDTPFLEYSALYWGTHMKKEFSDRGKTLALKLFSRYGRHVSIKILLEHRLAPYEPGSVFCYHKFTGLHCASIFGLFEIARVSIEMHGADVNGVDHTNTTPLIWAARNGHEAVVALLLEHRDVDPDMLDYHGQTPISRAAENGHGAVVALLLRRKDVNPNLPDLHDRTPISWAAGNGHEAVVRLLLGRKHVNPNIPDKSGETPILWAAENGHEVVVRLLLGREDVNPNGSDSLERTAILQAAQNRHEAVVALLLRRKDVNPNKPDAWDRTPISWAAGNGDEATVKLLLGREDVNPNRSEKSGQTPISWAARNGHVAVVTLLLGRKDVNPDSRTPILWAAENGYEGLVKLLLGREDVSPDGPDRDGRTPISWAAGNGHVAVVELLLGREDVNPDSPDRLNQTPILWAARSGHEAVVKLLLGREGVNPDTPDSTWSRTPVLWAAREGHEAVVKLLLGREDVNPSRPDSLKRTPILQAAKNGHEAVVALLLEREDINPNKPDVWDRTPISWAAGNGHQAVVRVLLGRKGVNPDTSDRWNQTPILWAAGSGHEAVVKLLLGWGDDDPDRPDISGLTTLVPTTISRAQHAAMLTKDWQA